MKKVNHIGKPLSKKEQKLIVGGHIAEYNGCPPFSPGYPSISVNCGSGETPLENPIDHSAKCCHTIHDCCHGKRCDGSTFEIGSGCAYRSPMQVSFVR
jgi:hypothetical protein